MTTAAQAPPKTKKTTEYVVLRDAGTEYLPGANVDVTSIQASLAIVGTFKATSANDAIKQAAGDKAGTYRAIPKRSWKPVKVTVHTETTVRLG